MALSDAGSARSRKQDCTDAVKASPLYKAFPDIGLLAGARWGWPTAILLSVLRFRLHRLFA